MSQQAYLLKRLKTVRFPHRFVVLHQQNDVFCFRLYQYDDGLWELREEVWPGQLDIWWTCLESYCATKENVWVVGWKTYESLCKLGIYSELESGRVGLKKRQRVKNSGDAEACWEQQAGAFVCDSPPTIIDLEFGTRRGCRVIDLENWGLEQRDWLGDCDESSIDCAAEALQDYVAMVRSLKMGSLSATAASQGYTRFRAFDLGAFVLVHQDSQVRQLERSAFFGGRCEALQVGQVKGPLYYVDVKAMYSSIGVIDRFPTELCYADGGEFSLAVSLEDDQSYVIASVEIETDQPRYPCRVGLHTYYPIGKFRTSLCDPELRMAYALGHVRNCISLAVYRQEFVWRDYAEWYISSLNKLEGLGLAHMRSALKLAVNASYGKVGAVGKRWVDVVPDGTADKWGQWWREHPVTGETTQGRAINGIHQYLDQHGEPSSSIPSLAAAMTSYGRVWLWDLMDMAGMANVFYVDTDGLIVNDAGLAGLKNMVVAINAQYGDLTVRLAASDAWIGGIKHYRLGDSWVQAGVPRDAERRLDGRATWTEDEPFSYGLWHGDPFQVRKYERTRYGARPYMHGTVGPDGRVSPLRADVLVGPEGPETVIYGRYGEIRESTSKKLISSKPS